MKTQRRKAAETQSEELDFAPSRLGASALNVHAPTPALKGQHTIAQGNALDSAPPKPPSPESAADGDLPEGWRIRRLGELVARPQYGVTASAIDDPNGPRFLRITDIQESGVDWTAVPSCVCDKATFARVKLLPGDLVVARIGATTGKAYLIRDNANAVFASYLIRLRATEGLEPEFLQCFTGSSAYWRQINAVKGGRLKQGVNIPLLESLELALPPLPEQQAIAAALRTVQQAKEACERVLAATRQLKQSLLHHLFTYGPIRFPQAAHVPLKETDIGPMPDHWQTAKLGDFTLHSAFGPRFGGELYDPTGNVATLRTTDISDDGRINYATMPRARITEERFHSHFLNKGDILVTRSGTCGIASVFEGFGIPVLAGAFLIRFVLKDALSPHFLRDYFNSPVGRPRVDSMASGAVQKNISGTSLKAFAVPVPPLSEQQEIAAQLAAVDAKLAAEESRRSALAALFQSLLHHLMTGKIRLPEFAGAVKIVTRKDSHDISV